MTILKRVIVIAFTVGLFTSTFAQSTNTLNVSLSADIVQQSDTLVVKVLNEPELVTGSFGGEKINFFKATSTNDWIAIIGIDVNKKPINYKLTIKAKNKVTYVKVITVLKRDFKVTPLVIYNTPSNVGYTPKKVVSNSVNVANPILNRVLKVFTKTNYFTQSFAMPLASTTLVGEYGNIRKSGKSAIQHLGADLRAATGTNVFAINDGKVVLVRSLPNYGNTIVIDHGLGIYSLYLHLNQFNSYIGQIVKKGDIVALSGDTGYVNGAHLHFSIKVGKASVDPIRFIETMKLQLPSTP